MGYMLSTVEEIRLCETERNPVSLSELVTEMHVQLRQLFMRVLNLQFWRMHQLCSSVRSEDGF